MPCVLAKALQGQGTALGPNIQVRTRSVPRMADVSQVSFILSWRSSLMLNRIENLGLQVPLVSGTGQLLLVLIARASEILIFSLALMSFGFQA